MVLTHISNAANLYQSLSRIPLGLPVPPTADDRPDFGLLRAWLDWCDNKHECNKNQSNGDMPLSTRLLYVGAVNDPSYDPDFLRLDLGSKIQAGRKYIALSHRWGDLLAAEKEKFCTSRANIDHRLEGFSLRDLRRTFQDAVKATRQLRIPYLWIDSLCIIQYGDEGEDWRLESQHMETVFSAAYCTIAATSAKVFLSEPGLLNLFMSRVLRASGSMLARTLMTMTRMWEMRSSTGEHGSCRKVCWHDERFISPPTRFTLNVAKGSTARTLLSYTGKYLAISWLTRP
jgi:hypothetical protein